jgi:putative oxidoreductase
MNTKTYNILLWIAQVLLAIMFGMAGLMKTSQPITSLAEMLPWVEQSPELLVRIIGVSELLAAVGLLLPAILKIQPKLTAFAGLGLAVIMLLALIFHISRGEYEAIGINVILGAIAYFVYWGRNKKAPIVKTRKS